MQRSSEAQDHANVVLVLLIIAFGVFAIVKRKVHITSNWTLTGNNARNFGSAVVVGAIPVSLILQRILPLLLPDTVVYHPIGGRLLTLACLAILLLLLALAFEDDKPARVNW
jgi:hypothetical protein